MFINDVLSMKKSKMIRALLIVIILIFTLLSCSDDTKQMYSLNASSNPSEGGTINPTSGEYEEGTEITIRINSNTYYEFDKWSGSWSGSESPLTITMDSDKNLVGNFKLMDSDGDGVTDDVDVCSGTLEGQVVDENGCSNSQKDTDGDGVTDDVDVCPGTPEGQVVDENGCSNSQKDTDGDGVTDDVDVCPGTPEGQVVDENGCIIETEYVLSFDVDNYVRFPNIDAYDNLDSMTIEFWGYLNSNPTTDEILIGTEYYNTGWHFYPGMWAMIGGNDATETISYNDGAGSVLSSYKWFHIALQYNSELNENQWKLYIDGELHEQKTGYLSSIGDGGDIVINRHRWASVTGFSSRLSGYIDEVRFSKIARYSGNFTPETKQLQNDENTLLLLNFENTTSNQVIDSSNNKNHGTINGIVNYVLRNDIKDK